MSDSHAAFRILPFKRLSTIPKPPPRTYLGAYLDFMGYSKVKTLKGALCILELPHKGLVHRICIGVE